MTQAVADATVSPATKRLRVAAIAALVLVGLQVVLGGALAAQITAIEIVHAIVAYTLFLVTIVMAVLAWGHAKAVGRKGVFFHGVAIPVLMVVQIGLGSMEVTIVHMILGLAIAVAIGALYAMVAKVPGEPDPEDEVDLIEE
ncbi:hypothetical protein ACSDQ9_03825 [Aestuariimicrobium soli]|uniref:hypothetical protein n=1 Tax=Aestuariimicrobium soli TaxID=2035834 RepID=UPI003EB92FCB